MNQLRKHMALLLSLALLISMVAVTTTVSADPTALLELDFSNFAAEQAAPSATPNPSGIVASGDLAESTGVSFAERVPGAAPDYNEITKESFENANGGTTNYIKFFDPSIYPNYTNPANSWVAHTKNAYVTNAAFEGADNTISFWVDATACGYAESTPHGFWKEIFCYRIDYTSDVDKAVTFDLGINPDGTWNALSAPREYTANTTVVEEYPDGAFEVPSGWKHVVITNPKVNVYTKIMDVYVNGIFVKSVEITLPDPANRATMHFFGNSCTNDEYWKSRLDIVPEAQLGGLKVYDGVLSADDVLDLYNAQLPEFTDVNSKTIEGYTFENKTVDFNGENQSIEVTAAADATEGVDIAYTCNGEAFTGATTIGSYTVTATITKEGYAPLVLSAVLRIKRADVNPQDGDPLIDLDFASYVKNDEQVDPANVEGSVGEVTNSGVLYDSTVLKFKSSAMANNWCNYSLALESFKNSEGSTTNYLHKTVGVDSCTDRNRFSTITETALEEQANTITFWINYVPQTRAGVQWNILDYYAVYGGTGSHLFTIEQAGTGDEECVLTGRGETPNYGGITSKIGQWIQLAVTNPEYELNAETGKYEKKMAIYVNGEKKGERTVEKPEGALSDVKIGLFGEVTSTSGKNWPQDASIAGVKVLSGALSSEDIANLYTTDAPLYTPDGETPPLKNITGYTFTGKSFEFDAATHNILVSAAQGATEDVDIAYTCDGAPFTGASDVGVYTVTATLTKEGYNDLVLTATLTITEPGSGDDYDVEIITSNGGVYNKYLGAGNVIVTVSGDIDPATSKVTVGGVDLYYVASRDYFVGVVPAYADEDAVKAAIEVADGASETIVYGKNPGNTEGNINASDFAAAKKIALMKITNPTAQQLLTFDVGNGAMDGSVGAIDFATIKRVALKKDAGLAING